MANWISSKLKVAETFLQQIDQQAADSLRKGEKPEFTEPNHQFHSKKFDSVTTGVTPDQLKKKSNNFHSVRQVKTPVKLAVNLDSLEVKPVVTDSDWTELLSAPDQPKESNLVRNAVVNNRGNGTSRKLLELKRNQRRQGGGFGKNVRKLENVLESKVNGGGPSGTGNVKRNDEEESSSGDSVKVKPVVESEKSNVDRENEELIDVEGKGVSVGPIVNDEGGGIGGREKEIGGGGKENEGVNGSVVRVESSLSSDETSGSGSDSSSGSDSEKEREREAERVRKREHVLAERAVQVIKEQENIVARLEGEKQSLEKILEERAKQQALEASELQMSMMETLDAVDLEKQKHNNTRMEAFARLTKLETANADLAKSLATTQWNLQIESNQVAELRQQIELKEAIQDDLKRRIAKMHQKESSQNQLEALKDVEFEREILEAEYSLTCDKVGQLQEKENKLKENIELLQREISVPTDVEVELKRRLGQLTNHLIQKQSQVEALSSEKATLLFRIETVSRLLEEEKLDPLLSDVAGPSSSKDLEAGTWGASKVKLRPLFAANMKSGSRHLGSLLWQLDAIFSSGAAFIRRNPPAKYMALFYLVSLHFWVLYILMSHSQASDTMSGAVISLENINKTTGTSIFLP